MMSQNINRDNYRKHRILIVDDQSFNIDAALIILNTSLKLNTAELCSLAYNGREAVKKVVESVQAFRGERCGYDLILMDCNMPFMDGYEATSEIREYLYARGIHQPIIAAVTGHTEPEYIARAVSSGMNQVLSKPILASVLKKTVKKLHIS